MTRRSFLGTSAAAAGALYVPFRLTQPKRILMLGGTGWLGPAIVRAGLERGHTFTLFNRGRSNPHLFPEVDKRKGQRRRPRPGSSDPAQDLSALERGEWDAVVDTSAYFTGEVEDVAKVLQGRVGQYVFISSLSVYPALGENADTITEDAALATCEDKYTTDLGKNFERYGALKRYGEDAAEAAFPGRTTKVRPGYIVGPGDKTDRWTYWPKRLLRGGEILAPGDRDQFTQFVDVRDLGAWIVKLIEDGSYGPFNATGFDARISMAEFLHTGKGSINHRCSFTWVDDAFLEEHEVTPWGQMPAWMPAKRNGYADNRRAMQAGLTFRPIAQTLADTAAWVQDGRGDGPWRAGMSAEREAELLAAWRKRQ
ncbi:MAG: NAD-dependent epimerase/dehydratase family protein [Planctomycetota bacterium]